MDYYTNREGHIVTAMRLDLELVTIVSVWCGGVPVDEIDLDGKKWPGLNVQCGDTVKRASLGDYIVKKEDGKFDVKKPYEFSQVHTPA